MGNWGMNDDEAEELRLRFISAAATADANKDVRALVQSQIDGGNTVVALLLEIGERLVAGMEPPTDDPEFNMTVYFLDEVTQRATGLLMALGVAAGVAAAAIKRAQEAGVQITLDDILPRDNDAP